MPAGGLIAAGIGAGVGGLGSFASGKEQANAEKYAANLQAQSANNSLAFDQNVFNKTQTNEAPYIAAGQGAVTQLSNELAPGGDLSKQWNQTFNFTPSQETLDPAYQFNLNQGLDAIQRQAAASGNLLSGGELKEATGYAQGNALNAYQQSYNNALTNYQTAYQSFLNNQNNQFTRLSNLAGIGQGGTGQLAQAGTAAANTYANTATTSAANQGNFLSAAGGATAAGIAGASNAITSGTNNIANILAMSNQSSFGSGGFDYSGVNNSGAVSGDTFGSGGS